jgi:hypothetical protein
MSQQPPTNNPSPKPPAEPLTEAERIELRQERDEAQRLFEKLLEQDRQPKADSPAPIPPNNARKSRGTNFPAR